MKGIALRIYLQPRSAKNEIVGPYRDGMKVRVTAPPTEGKANEALIRFLAKELGVAPSSVEIIRGHRSREKILRIGAPLDEQTKKRLPLPERDASSVFHFERF